MSVFEGLFDKKCVLNVSGVCVCVVHRLTLRRRATVLSPPHERAGERGDVRPYDLPAPIVSIVATRSHRASEPREPHEPREPQTLACPLLSPPPL